MALNKEHSRDKTEWVKWPHLENHWRPQHYETPHRASKKSDNSRSHSWWWDSHISPKSSKWLQENLAEMDSKVSAMLKIIEEDADSFAKRAEMYYKRRPELINLVEEFYRTYRALVERHTFLTKELRQNIAPALHAHLTGAAYEPPFKIPTDPPVKHGSDGFDIASLSSYSFSGALESEEDSQSEFSAKSSKGPVDEEDVSPRSSRVSFETREFGFQPFGLSSEEEHVPLQHQNKTVDGYEGENSSMELRKTAQILEDEKKALIVKSGEDEIKLKDLRLEVSSLLSKTKALEAEEKLAKDRLHELLQLKQTLEAENLKLSHALIASKEEKTQLAEARDQSLQEVLASGRRIQELEEEIALLQQKTAASHSEVLFGQEQVKQLEDESKKLQHSLAATQERNQRDALALKETFEKRLEGLHRQIIDLEEDNGCLKEQGAARSVQLQELKQQAMEVGATNIQLEQDLFKLQKSKEAVDLENSTMVVKIEGLGRELEATQRREQELLEHIMQKDGQMSKLEQTLGNVEEHRTRLEAEKDEMLKYTLRLEAESKELQRARDSVLVQSQQHESQCQALEAARTHLNKQVESLQNNNTSLQKEKMSVESMLVKANSEVKELHGSLNAMLSEKILLLEKASHNIDASHNENDEPSQEPVLQTAHFRDLELALSRLLQENGMLGKREAKALISFSDLEKASQAQTEKFKQILNEHLALIAERDVSLTNLIKQKDFLENQGREALQSNSRLKKELSLLKTERMKGSKLAERLQAEVKDLKNAQEHTFAECQRCEEERKALKEAEEELKVLLAAKQAEGSSLQKDKAALGGELAKLSLQMQELHTNMSDLSSQKAALRLELDEALERIRIVNAECGRWQGKAEECEAEISMLRNEAVVKAEFTSKLENEVETQSMGIQKLEEEIALFQIERNNVTSKMAEYEVKVHDLEAKASESLAAQTALNEEAAHKSHTIESLKMELAGICKENNALCEKFAVCSAHASLLQNQVAKCREFEDLQHVNLQKHADTIRSMEIEIENLKRSVSEAEERNNALICEQQKNLDENSCMHRKIRDLEEQAHHFAEDKELVIKGHEEQNEKLQMQLQSSSGIIQSMEAELVKLHKAVSPTEEANLISGCQQSRSFDAGFIMPDRITHIHQKVGGLLEERALLVSRVSYHIEQRDEMELRLHSLERDKDNLLDKLKNEQQVAFEAKRNIEKLEGELSQLRKVNAKVENELRMKSMDLSSAQEEALGAKARNDILEAEVQQHLHEINILNEDVERLGHQLQDAQQEIKGLEENLSLSASKCSDAEKAACDARQETSKHIADGESLRHRMAVLLADVSKLQQDTTDVKEEKRILFCKVEALQLELDRSHSEREQLMLQMKDRTSELDERRVKVENLQQQLDAVQSGHSLLTENFSEAKNQWAIEQVEVQEMLAQLKATSLEGQKNLEAQLESENKLKTELFHMQQDNKKLEELLSQAVNKHMDAEKAIVNTKEELNKQIANKDLQNSEMVVAASNIGKLEHDLAGLQDEKQSLLANLEATQLEMSQVQGENKHLMSQAEAVTVQLQGKDSEIQKLQEQLQGAESNNCSLVEALSSMKLSWGAEQERLQGELAQLTATNLEGQKDLAIQLDCVRKLMDELTGLHSERSHLQEDRDLHAKQLADQLNQIEDARKRDHDKDAELFELSALAEALKQSLLAKDSENLKLREELSKSAQCQIESEKKLMDEISFLQSEEMRWRNEVTTNSALMAEKVACLRMENAALHEDLSSKLELLLKLEKDLELLREERSSLFQALQAMAAEMQEYKNDLQIFKEAVIPSLEERVGELQDEITDLTISIESHVAEIKILQKQLKDATGELLRLHDENATLKIELTFNVEMLKHVDGVSSLIKAENLRLFDKLGLQEQHSRMQGQLLATASSENEGLSRRLVLATEERNGLKTELRSLISVVTEVEQLQRELAAAREDHGSVRRTEPSCIQKVVTSLSNSDGGSMDASESIHAHTHGVKKEHTNTEESVEAQMHKVKLGMVDLEHGEKAFPPESQRSMESLPLAGVKDESMSDLGASEEGSDGKLTVAASSHALLIGSLKEEILYLQEEIQKLQLATGGQGPGIASNEGAARDLRSPSKSSTASSSSILTIEEAQETLDDVQRLKDENCDLVEEINSLKSQSLAAWMENNLVEDLVKQLQANLALSQEQNGHLCSEISACKELIGNLEEESHSLQQENEHLGLEVSSCKVDIARLGGECHSLQAKNAELQENLKASAQEKQKSEDALHMLEDVITSLERNNRRLQAENESANMEMKKLNSSISCLHDDGSELIALIKAKMMAVLEQVKLTMNECQKETGDEGIVQIIEDVEHVSSSPPGRANASFPADEHSKATMESADHKRALDAMTELEARNMLILTELQARAEETNTLLEFVVSIRKMLIRYLGREHTCQRDAPLSNLEGEEGSSLAERSTAVICDEHHIKLAERLHQAFMDERLEHEVLELNEGRKQLKEELEARLAEVQRMESELEKFQVLLEHNERSKERERVVDIEEKRRNTRAEESAKELRDMLAQQRRRLGRMQEEVMFGDEQQEAAVENRVTVLVSTESTASMEGWDDEQVNLLSRELESLRGLNRRHSAELQTISQDLQSMGSIIKEAQDQLLLAGSSQDDEEEIISMADLRTQKSSIIDLRTPDRRISGDSTQQLLSPSPRIEGGDADVVLQSRSEGGTGQFGLKPRNFGFTWFLLLFSPDRKAGGLARSRSNKRWAALKPIWRSGSDSTALVVERERRKAAGCWACVSSTSRLDSFDGR